LHLLNSDRRNKLKLISAGVKLFKQNKAKDEEGVSNSQYRICQDGLQYIIPFITKRLYLCDLEFFINILTNSEIKIADIKDEELLNYLSSLTSGCIIFIAVKNKKSISEISKMSYNEYTAYLKENYLDSICGFKSAFRLISQISKDHQHVFNLKYNIPEKTKK
jgi:hypothetical protein